MSGETIDGLESSLDSAGGLGELEVHVNLLKTDVVCRATWNNSVVLVDLVVVLAYKWSADNHENCTRLRNVIGSSDFRLPARELSGHGSLLFLIAEVVIDDAIVEVKLKLVTDFE